MKTRFGLNPTFPSTLSISLATLNNLKIFGHSYAFNNKYIFYIYRKQRKDNNLLMKMKIYKILNKLPWILTKVMDNNKNAWHYKQLEMEEICWINCLVSIVLEMEKKVWISFEISQKNLSGIFFGFFLIFWPCFKRSIIEKFCLLENFFLTGYNGSTLIFNLDQKTGLFGISHSARITSLPKIRRVFFKFFI